MPGKLSTQARIVNVNRPGEIKTIFSMSELLDGKLLDSKQFKELFEVEEFNRIVNLAEGKLKQHISYRGDNVQEVCHVIYIHLHLQCTVHR